ncbi:MAG TPA: DUF6797 domain-containing protein [Candidatus Angelobacter sp.]|nr:DUF6797 domain-containing protein [Candidatus Angelobacter sp.]
MSSLPSRNHSHCFDTGPGASANHLFTFGLGFLLAVAAARAANRPGLLQEDFPFQGACISAKFPGHNVAMKGLAIRAGNGVSMLFDTELLRMAAGWTGGYITTRGVAFDGEHGVHPSIEGEQKFGVAPVPGWADARGEFGDPRSEPFGPLPDDWAHWDGLYVHGTNVVLAYTVHGTKIYEQPSSVASGGQIGFVRTFRIEKTGDALAMVVCEVGGASGEAKGNVAHLTTPDGVVTAVGAVDLPTDAGLEVVGNRVVLRLPKGAPAGTFKLVIWNGSAADLTKFAELIAGKPALVDFARGGPAHWEQEVVTKGALETSKTPDGAYVTDSLTPPLDNPWKRRVRLSGLDFFADGKRAALCTWDGDIWIVSGIDGKLENLRWRRFASGMYETLGLKIVNGVIYTSGRDQITRYRDLNNDGEADYYENFCNLYTSTEGFHEFVFDLQTDRDGNFYFAKAGPVNPGGQGFQRIAANAGTLMKVSADGKKLEVIATGFRAPNGIGVSPTGQLTTGDNQGTWVPTDPLNWIKSGGFYGVEDTSHRNPIPEFKQPLMWFAYREYDNSTGGQAWVTSDKWGPFQGELLHTSYGKCALYLIAKEQVSNLMQGGAVRFPLKFGSSAMRPRFNPGDGQLYVCGLQGWQTEAAKLSGFDRVRYTGKPVYMARGLKVDKTGVHITFTQPLDAREAADPQNYSGKRWNYRRTSNYGSDEYSVADPNRKGRDTLNIKAANLSNDGKTVTLAVDDLRPANVEIIRFNLRARDGTAMDSEIQHTINAIP